MQINGTVNDWETIAVPLVGGIDVNTRARLVDPSKLLSAKNCYFPRNGGPEKRKGYTARAVEYGTIAQPPTTEEYLYGWGWVDISTPEVGARPAFPQAGPLRGIAKRDNETVAWDGSKLWMEESTQEPLDAFLPTATTTPVAKTPESHNYTDIGDNGVIRVVATRDLADGIVRVFCYDSTTSSLRWQTYVQPVDPEFIYVVPCGDRIHLFIQDITDNVIFHYAIHNEDAGISAPQSLGVDVGAHFDVQKYSEEMMILAYVDTAQAARFMYIRANGEVDDLLAAANTQLDTGGLLLFSLGIAKHPVTGEVGLIWRGEASSQRCRIYDESGVALSSILVFANDPNCAKVCLTTNYTYDSEGYGTFYGYSDKTLSTDRFVRMRSFTMTANGAGELGGTGITNDVAQRYNVNLVGHAFRVGEVPFVWVCYPSDFQTTYLLLDKTLLPCGKLEYGTASNNTADPWLFSCNTVLDSNFLATDFHCGLMYKQRVLDQDGVFHEVGTKFCQLDFLPEFRRVQAGRCLYLPGAQLWQYDGKELVEQGFHFTPEDPVLNPDVVLGGAMVGNYQYRIYPCYKNAQGEEVRGPALLTAQTTVGGADTGVRITINTFPTRREGSYFLVYRNVNAGSVWYLVSDRDPASTNCPKNLSSVVSTEYVDTAADSSITDNELDPASTGYLHAFSAPACTVLSYGKDRLWLAGGELTNGTILPSRLFLENETPAFHLNLAYSIDRDASPITGLGFLADYLTAFKEDKTYIVTGDPADNISQGDNLRVQLALSDVGCISHNSIVRLSSGLAFQSQGGIRILTPSGSIASVGLDVDRLTNYVTDAVLDTENRLVKFYQNDEDSLVLDYEGGQWTTWTIRTLSAVSGKLVKNYKIWSESDDYTDDGANYLHSIRLANIGPTLGGLYRVRRVGGIGEADQNYLITVRTYLDENSNFSEEWDWDSSEDLNTSTWGSGTWGSGFWGDSSGTSLYAKDSIWRWRHRCAKQKCSCISIEIEYNGPDKGPVHTAILFEIGRKKGLDRGMK